MKNSSAPIIFAIALSVATTLFLTVAGGGTKLKPIITKCEGVPSMPATAACGKMSGGAKRMAELCTKVLGAAPANSETSMYAYKALEAAEASTEATDRFIDGQLSHNKSLHGDLRAAYNACSYRYEFGVMDSIDIVKGSLAKCDFEEIAVDSELVTAVASVDNCAHNLRRAGEGSMTLPLYDMVLGDKDMTVLASLLIGLAANKTSIGLA